MVALLHDRLTRRDYAVEVETAPESALARLANEDFDAVVTDVRMRGISGLELCERITASRPGLPVLVITAFGDLDTAVGAIRAGAWDFLTKPFEVEELDLPPPARARAPAPRGRGRAPAQAEPAAGLRPDRREPRAAALARAARARRALGCAGAGARRDGIRKGAASRARSTGWVRAAPDPSSR